MLAAEIWHWWIGVLLMAVGVLSVVGLAAQYLKNVEVAALPRSQAPPGRRLTIRAGVGVGSIDR